LYKEYEGKTVPECRESFGLGWVLAENALHLSAWGLAGALVWAVRCGGVPVVTLAWALLVVVVQVLLKKHNCSGCYYYGKTCHLGWGRLSAMLFARDSGDPKTGTRLTLFYVVAPPLFLLLGILVGVLEKVRPLHWILLAAYVAVNALAFALRPKGCRLCAMREVCPGSAARQAR
jgi:hypothetical protein